MVGKLIILAGIVTVVALTYFGWKLTARGAYDLAEYTVLVSEEHFETREYPDLIVATTEKQLQLQGAESHTRLQ